LVEAINQNSGLSNNKSHIISAIRTASERTGVKFSYLLNEAMTESSLNPNSKAKTSSATGLYQFVEQTWLKTVKQSGDKHGLGKFADKIQIGADGIARTRTYADRKEILALRKNPQISANMAGELAKSNERVLVRKTGREIGSTELYMAHFLGASGAAKFLNKMHENPNIKAADLLPNAAKANKSIFYDKNTGKARSVSQIYAKFAKKFDDMPDISTRYAQNNVPNDVSTYKWSPSLYSNNNNNFEYAHTSMLMAQMDMDSFALNAMDYVNKIRKYENHSILSTLAKAA